MKRLFQRPASSSTLRSSSKGSIPSSPDKSEDGSPPSKPAKERERRSYSPEKLTSMFRKSSPEKREMVTKKQADEGESGDERKPRPTTLSMSDDELHGKVVEYLTAATEEAQHAALQEIHVALVDDSARMRISQKDADRLLSVCAQRLRLAFQRRLEAFNTRAVHQSGGNVAPFLSESEASNQHYVVALGVLKELSSGGGERSQNVLLIVSERLPSTLVKVLKACSQVDSNPNGAEPDDCGVIDAVLSVLARWVQSPETVHELMEASTLHRLFYLSFSTTERQLCMLQLIDTLVDGIQDTMWGVLLTHLHDHNCLMELLAATRDRDAECLTVLLRITARILYGAFERETLELHKQLRVEQFYTHVFALFEATFRGVSSDGTDHHQQQQQDLRVAIGDLCLSGSESAVEMQTTAGDFWNDPCFALCDAAEKALPTNASRFNVDAFWLVCQVIEFLHCEDEQDRRSSSDRADHQRPLAWRQRLECQYIQKIGRLIAENRYDYVLVRRSGILEQLLRRLHELPDLSKHAVGSVLAATAIEANVIPYSELHTIVAYLTQTKTVSVGHNAALMVLLGVVANLLRFHDAYRGILTSTGVMEAILTLFQSQTMLLCSDEVASTKINVTYPTSTLKIGHSSWHRRYSPGGVTGNENVLAVNENNLITFLTSHCRQNSTVRRLETSNAVDRRVFDLMLEILTTFAASADSPHGGGSSTTGDRVEDALGTRLCEAPFLECLCVLLANRQFQEQALPLWVAVVQIALRIRKQNTSTYNSVNCFLQSLRYVALALYYKHEPGITFAFFGSIAVLHNGLECLEELLRPDATPEQGGLANSNDRDRVLVALVDSGALFTCLAVLCSVSRAAQVDDAADAEYNNSEKAFLLGMRLIHMCVAANATIAELFNSAITFEFYGALMDRFMQLRVQRPGSDRFGWACSVGLLGLAVNDYSMACRPDEFVARRGDALSKTVQHPGAVVAFIHLLSGWSSVLASAQVAHLLEFTANLLSTLENARVCTRANLCDVLLQCFGSRHVLIDDDERTAPGIQQHESLNGALVDEGNPHNAVVLSILKHAAACGVTHAQACRWIKLIADASAASTSTLIESRRSSSSCPLLQALTELASSSVTKSSLSDVPSIVFDASRDGFAQMQIPEVLVRQQQGLSSYYQNSGQSASTSAAASASASFAALTAKVWPPTDGYTVLQWFRIDLAEPKDAREKQYWDLLMRNQCVLCHTTMRDDTALKCSHRACRACLEALANCGGECVVCNPPMFYLFRFRSGDAKSVSEVFLRGPRLCMRTSASTKTGGVHQFSHSPLQVGRWYHVAIVHSRQRFQASQVSLYLNGLLQETVKISYPSSISSGQPLSGLVGIPPQARRISNSRWTLGPLYLLEDALSAHIVNCVFAAGPSYGGLFLGPSGSNEICVSGDHLTVESLLLLDEYTRDPIRTLIESVEAAERSGKNSILRSSLSLASAASSAAAAIVQDIKARSSNSSSVFARIPSAVPCVGIPFTQERILLVYSAGAAMGVDFSVVPSGKLDGRPLAQLLGGAEVSAAFSLADVLHDLCGSGPRLTYVLLEQATSAVELELVLELLWQLIRSHPKNLVAMECEHGYGIVNYLLHAKAGELLSPRALAVLFRITGIDIDIAIEDSATPLPLQPRSSRDSAVRNLQAMQHFILDYSLWQRAETSTQKLLFSSLYACLMAGGDDRDTLLRERNRAQLQSLSLVRQLLYVFLDPSVEADLVRVIVDLILVCLTGSSSSSSSSSSNNRNEASTVEGNFAEIASFLASTLSPRFTRSRGETEVVVHATAFATTTATAVEELASSDALGSSVESPIARLCLSPRGKPRNERQVSGSFWDVSRDESSLSNPASPQAASKPTSPTVRGTAAVRSRARQTQVQDLLLDILAKAVQKHDLKENRERDEVDGLYVDSHDGASVAATGGAATASGTGQRLHLPSSSSTASKLAGFRKVLSPRWIGYFLFPTADTSCSVAIAPSTIIAALKLLAALLARPRYESVFRKEGYYRLLSQGLPCDARAFVTSSDANVDAAACNHGGHESESGRVFPFDQLWYTLFCMLLGPPVDGMPHNLQFEMYFLTKDFALNVQRDRVVNGYIAWVILALIRRHYNDPIAFASLRSLRISPEKSILAQVAHALYATSTEERQTLLCHVQVLDFLHHIYTAMPTLRRLVVLSQAAISTGSGGGSNSSSSSGGGGGGGSSSSVSGSSSDGKLRGDLLEELSLLACGAARAELFLKYAPTEKRVHQTLLNQKKELNAHEFAVCAVQLAELSASEDDEGDDPFQHPVAVRALKLLVTILCDFLVLHPKGSERVEAFFDSHAGSALAPPLHDGLQLRFQALVMMGLLEQVRAAFCEFESSGLADNKLFAPNVEAFMALATQKMHVWQRAQHGDACPKAFACCGDPFHFAGGPFLLLDVALFVLGDPSAAGVTSSVSSSASSSSTSAFGQLIQDKLSKTLAAAASSSGSTNKSGGKPQKRRHTLRSMLLGKVQFGSNKSAELDGLMAAMHTAVDAVVLHVLHGHGSEVSDDECETLLQLLHINREVVLGPHNAQDKDFFMCLCRFLLQLLAASPSTESGGIGGGLQEIAAQVWIDLMNLQRTLVAELLTVEIRRAGSAAPYLVNLTKNGFDVLLECPRVEGDPGVLVTESPAFHKFKGWLEVVGPPLKELETKLDRVFVKRIVEAKEVVREAWTASHKRVAHRHAKEIKRFAARFEWFVAMEREYFETLLETQQSEFRRQLKWRQDRVDRHKFHARQWQQLRHDLMEQALRDREDKTENEVVNPLLPRPTKWQLDATEGPSRMRKRLLAKSDVAVNSESGEIKPRTTTAGTWKKGKLTKNPSILKRRRFSESDVEYARQYIRTSSSAAAAARTSIVKAPHELQLRGATNKKPSSAENETVDAPRRSRPRPMSRRLSFENVLRRTELDSAQASSGGDSSRRRKDSLTLSAVNDEDDQEASSVSATNGFDGGDEVDESDVVDEKLRPLLVPGDEILEMSDCLRVDGMDACPGVFLLASDHLYIIDNYQLVRQYGPMLPESQERRRGAARGGGGGGGGGGARSQEVKVMEVSAEAPTRLERRLSLRFQLPLQSQNDDAVVNPLTPSSMLTMQRSNNTHQCRSWAYEDVVELHKRRHQLRHVALELFAHDGRNYLITFETPQQRENVFHALLAKCPNVRGASNGLDRTTTSGDLYSHLKKLLRQNMTERWISREISNFEYLMHLNTLAGRSYNDLTQYPVFPWVLADYTSSTIDLSDQAVYRDLCKPMGALFREEEFRIRYESLAESATEDAENPMGIKPFHYGTHYSSAGIVLHYLMRMEPFTTHFRRLQGGKFDHADRLFASVASAWKSAAGVDSAHNGTQDVKELTPEFFYLPSFLQNVNGHDFGKDQSGIAVDDVELPPWANGSAREFVRVNREALESHYVSANLHHWIDLIFGFKQQGSAAVDACNVFYHLTYEGAVDVDAITDVAMKRALVDQISEFGQTPSQLFRTPHPPRVRPPGSSSATTSSLTVDTNGSTLSCYGGAMSMGSPPPPSSLAPSSGGFTTTRANTLASSFIEGSDIVSRMHSILTNNSALGGTSLLDDSTAILDHAAMLQQEPRREVALNPLVLTHRGHHQQQTAASAYSLSSPPAMTHMRTRQLSSGMPAAPIHQIAIASASVTRDERVAAVGDNCLLIPPRHHEFFAWGFQDRSLKVLTTGVSEVAHGGESKVLSSFEIEFAISVACMTSDGRTLIAGGASAPVVRLWQFSSSSKKSAITSSGSGAVVVGSGGGGRRRGYSVGLHAVGQSHRMLTPMATLSSPSHQAPITAVQVCRAYSVLVSGCGGGTAVLWDLNRLRFVRTLARLQNEPSGAADPCSAIAINEVTGDIVVACGPVFGVYDVNGDVLARLSCETLLHDSQYPRAAVTSVAVNRSEASEWCREKAVITGHADGVLCIWAYSHTSYGDSDVAIELKGRHMITKALAGGTATSRSAITSVLLSQDERKLFTGNADGLLSLWTPLLQGNHPTTPTKSHGASASPVPAHPTNLI